MDELNWIMDELNWIMDELNWIMDELNWIMDETICNNTHRIHIEYTSPNEKCRPKGQHSRWFNTQKPILCCASSSCSIREDSNTIH